ncbi:hypothetical protein FEM55_02680 [Dyadobacter sediminis]|uniref:Peptidase M12A domain-containing protein n=2 Tax=Dyadobacter sediminis TaxID=1493691 RepID=A0A5R9KL27_9BACT|nr:hypothetical protein FEM55_02680 [Dyadobacter sediminis]
MYFFIRTILAFGATVYLSGCKDTFDEVHVAESKSDSSVSVPMEEAFPGQTGIVKQGKLYGIPVYYSEIQNQAVFEGDIILSKEQLSTTGLPDSTFRNGRTEGTGRSSNAARWPGNTVYYKIDPALPNQARVYAAIKEWETYTPLRFVLRTSQANYVTFRPGSGCSSHVGMIGGQQYINLASSCSTGNTVHEIAHAIGMWHEQSRVDRDKYVKILWENILPGYEHNFKTYAQQNMDGFDYSSMDLGSIMMYDSYAFTKNGKPTITRLNGSTYTVQRNALASRDIGCSVSMYSNLYTVKGDRLYAVSASTGQRSDLGGSWTGTEALVSYNNTLYGVQAGHLWKTDRLNGNYVSMGPDYGGTLAMTVLNNYLYVIQLGSLWQVNPLTGAYAKIGTANWNGSTAMTAYNGQLFVVKGDYLYRVNPTNGNYQSMGPTYQGTTDMAVLNGSIYLVESNRLWRVNPVTGSYVQVGTEDWSGTTAMTSLNGYLYVVQGDVLYRVAYNGTWKALSSGWTGVNYIASISQPY